MARFLDERYDWDLMAVQFQVTDSIYHDLDDSDKIRQVLEKVDEFVGDIIALDRDAAVFIVSDHGMGDYRWTFYINSWLAANGYAETTTGDEEYFRDKKVNLKGKDDEYSSLLQTSLGTVMTALSTIGLPPNRIHRLLSSIGLAGMVERLLPEKALLAAQDQTVDYENSTAFQIFYNSLGIHLNLEGREPRGTVAKEQYDDLRSGLIEELSEIRDPDGNLVFDEVLPKEAVYGGKNIEKAPDILLVPRDYRYDVSGSIVEPFRRNPHKNHRPEGLFVTNLDTSESLDEASIYDIAPTVAASLGLPIDTQADGEVLPVVKDHGKRADWSEMTEQYRSTAHETTDREVEERLEDLGYME
jgi:predicted AlkP superfamily phosphohydrolase/phosphomutase